MKYIPLHVKTNYTLLSSLVDIKQLVKQLKAYNIDAVAITDTNVMYGVMTFYHECIKNNIKPIIGIELEIGDHKILLYAQNYQGYQNLCKLVTIKSEQDVNFNHLKDYSQNLICIIPFRSISLHDELKAIYKHLFLGYSFPEEQIELGNIKNKVFINEVLYLNKEDSKYLSYLYAIRDNKKIDDIKEYPNLNHHLMKIDEVLSISDKEGIDNTNKIAELCDLKMPTNTFLLPKYDPNIDAPAYLTELCKKGLSKRLNNKVSKTYADRLYYELDIINKMGFADYFLVVWDFIKYAKKNNILVGPGRGSSASSLVSYSLGITDIDPVKYNLLFERFLNPERITMPDIDIDFPDIYRDQVINYVVNQYGPKQVTQIITFGTLGIKQAIRDVGRVLDVPIKVIDQLTNLLTNNAHDIKKIYQQHQDFKNLIDSMPLLKELYQVVSVIEGMPRHTSIHAAGIIISNQPLDNIIPLLKSSNGIYTTGYSMEYLEELGLLKMDFLGLKNLTLIMNIIDSIKQTEKIEIDFNNIPLDDPKTLDLFNKANTEGIFQFESTGMKNFLSKLKVKHFEDIVVANALFRPGPMANIDSYIKRKFNKEAIDYIHPDLHEILVPTYGIIVYQEQIMQIATIMAGYTLGEADVLRRAMGKKELSLLVNDQAKFISRCLERGYTKEVADKVFSLILKFANYGFNRSHSVAYAHIGYKMAYLKAHYLKHFIVNLLNSVIGSDLKTKKYIYEAKLNNINILKPDINLSNVFYKAEALGIRFSLSSIRNLGLTTCQAIIKERIKGPYRDFIDFILRTYGKSVNVKTIESLIKANCFSAFGYNQKTLLHNLEKIINYVELSRELNADTLEKPQIEIVPEFNKEQLMAHDIEMFGFYLSNHPATKYKATTKVIDIINIANFFNQTIEVIGYIENIKVIKTKKNEDMAFITISDELSTIDLILFPKTYLQYKTLKVGNIIKVNGKVERRLANYQLIVNNITIVE